LVSTVFGQDAPEPQSGDPAISDALARILTQHKVPAMAGAIVTSAGLQKMGAAGWRKAGDPTPATVDDQWHLGSDTKAMTATVIARFVERGLLRWDSAVSQVLPEAGPGWDKVTLDHLLTHRAGIAIEPNYWDIPTRAAAVLIITARPPATVPGSTYHYSNSGYVLAGAMLERVAGQPWEALIRSELWEPLHMEGCGFGGMGTPGRVDQPWQHKGTGEVAGNGPQTDNPPVMGPAGTLHMPIKAWASFIADQLKGARGELALLSTPSYKHLQAPWPGGEYALGWIAVQRSWAKGAALTHTGSNTMSTAVVWMAPGVDMAVLVNCNQGEADAACDDAAVALIKLAGIQP
jgi:CubicO group peptidase (beta-lactamase class C family)